MPKIVPRRRTAADHLVTLSRIELSVRSPCAAKGFNALEYHQVIPANHGVWDVKHAHRGGMLPSRAVAEVGAARSGRIKPNSTTCIRCI